MNDTPEYSVQFCDREANQDITGSPTAERDATEIRLWTADGTCIVAVERVTVDRAHQWRLCASDVTSWAPRAHLLYRDWRDAMTLAGPAMRDQIETAGY